MRNIYCIFVLNITSLVNNFRHLLQPSFGLRREKTVVDVDVSDDQKELVYKQLIQQQTNLQRKMSVDQQRQADMVMVFWVFYPFVAFSLVG